MRTAVIYDIDDLRRWFLEMVHKHGYYSVYNGHEKNSKDRLSSLSYTDNDHGWRQLQDLITMHSSPGALFTVYVSSSEKDTGGLTTHYSVGYGSSSQSGIAGAPSVGSDAISQIASDIANRKIEEFKKDLEIENLKAEINEIKKSGRRKKGGLLADLGEMLEEYPTLAGVLAPVVNSIAGRFLGNFAPAGAAGAIAGVPDKITHVAGPDPDDMDEDFADNEVARIMNCMSRLSRHFEDPVEVLEKVADAADKDPDKVKMGLSFLS